jgi:hypothetical protein
MATRWSAGPTTRWASTFERVIGIELLATQPFRGPPRALVPDPRGDYNHCFGVIDEVAIHGHRLQADRILTHHELGVTPI